MHAATFIAGGHRYKVSFTEITPGNRWDSSVVLPPQMPLPAFARHFDLTFDNEINQMGRTWYDPISLPAGLSCTVFKQLERLIIAHYSLFRVGLYTFTPASFKLANLYCRMVCLRKHQNVTLEVGLEPNRRAHVLRTPYFYQP